MSGADHLSYLRYINISHNEKSIVGCAVQENVAQTNQNDRIHVAQ